MSEATSTAAPGRGVEDGSAAATPPGLITAGRGMNLWVKLTLALVVVVAIAVVLAKAGSLWLLYRLLA